MVGPEDCSKDCSKTFGTKNKHPNKNASSESLKLRVTLSGEETQGLFWELNPGPLALASGARIMPLDQTANWHPHIRQGPRLYLGHLRKGSKKQTASEKT